MKTNPARPFLLRHLPEPLTPGHLLLLRDWAAASLENLAELVQVFLSGNEWLAHRAVRVLSDVPETNSQLLEPYLPQLIATLNSRPHVAIRRNMMRLLQKASLPPELQGQIAQHCFNYIEDPKEPVAVRAFAVTVLARICQLQPELIREFALVLDSASFAASPGMTVRIRDARKKLGLNSGGGNTRS